jgi:ribonuclease P protein component
MKVTVGRLVHRREFQKVAASRQRHVTPGFILQSALAPGKDLRVGFTVSRKVGTAVARNRAKRRLRELVRETMPVHAAPGHDYVLIGRAATVSRPFALLRQDLELALKRLGVWRGAEGA